MTICIGIRGATQSETNSASDIYAATRELLEQMIEKNGILEEQVAVSYTHLTLPTICSV